MAIYRLLVAACCLLLAWASKINDLQKLNFEPKVAIQCGKVAKHIDVETGNWIDDEDRNEFCSSDNMEILKFCQRTYPNINITNIVEANENVTLCDGDDCQSSRIVIPHRCLVGEFEVDGLSYPSNAGCKFDHILEGETCNGHDYWHDRAHDWCKKEGKKLTRYGILVPCDIDMFRGVEFVCCKAQKVKTVAEIFEDKLNQFANHIPALSKGCDRSKYDFKSRLVRLEKNKNIKDLANNLNEAKNRKEAIEQDDPQQAQSLFKNALSVLKSTIMSIEQQARLNEARIHQERRECLQIDMNHKKHIAMKSYVGAIRDHVDDPTMILKTFSRVMRVLDNDQSHNSRFIERLMHSKSDEANNIREAFVSHLHLIKSTLKEAVEILKNVKSVEGKIAFSLPSWAGDIDFSWAHKPVVRTNTINPTDPPTRVTTAGDPNADHIMEDFPPENEHQDYGDHPLKSRAVFAAVIGLSCGALVIMVVIVLALFFRKGSSKRPTKTVIAEDDSQEKRHLLKMQEDGFENPTYKFFVH